MSAVVPSTSEARMPASFLPICPVDDIPLGLGRAYRVGERSLAIFRSRAGTLHAVDNKCPHKGGPLADGMLMGDKVVCPLHQFKFELAGGSCDQPGVCPVEIYETQVHGGMVYVRLFKDAT